MIRTAARRIAILYLGLVGGTVVISALLGLAAGASILRSIAVGLYVAGGGLLVGCFITGVRGPLRGVSKEGDPVPVFIARRIRRATTEERSDAAQLSILLFFLGIGLIVLGALADPAHTTF